MKRLRVLLLFVLISCFAQNKKEFNHFDLKGVWLSTLEDGYTYECPDAIQFMDDGKYVVYNDCEGLDITNPIVEKGHYKIKNNEIYLYERTFILDKYYFLESFGKEDIYLEIKKLKEDMLILCFLKEDNTTVLLNYKKI